MEEKKRRLLTSQDPAAQRPDPAASSASGESATAVAAPTGSPKPATRVKPLSKVSIG
ncbi:hypothetical protein [Brevibacterium linens]|uniref:Uncharacterized protein n=1 Tax=Brevibacterium linens TaxID=1703 RepID=A0A2H1K865_BRELN|nr:hypothetical protein [Brevibacterium linens]SMX96007.1 hypothetical protein BLIN101_03105 [Brevibacterium linens]